VKTKCVDTNKAIYSLFLQDITHKLTHDVYLLLQLTQPRITIDQRQIQTFHRILDLRSAMCHLPHDAGYATPEYVTIVHPLVYLLDRLSQRHFDAYQVRILAFTTF